MVWLILGISQIVLLVSLRVLGRIIFFDRYDEIRRAIWHKIINPVSSDNILRLYSQDPNKALENDEFLIALAEAMKGSRFDRTNAMILNSELTGRQLMLFNMASLRIIKHIEST